MKEEHQEAPVQEENLETQDGGGGSMEEQLLELSLYCVTWNMNGKSAANPLLEELLGLPHGRHDVYVIGLQEMAPAPIEHVISVLLGEKYRKIDHRALMAINIVLYARQEISQLIREVRTDVVPTGLAGVVGNKGAAAIALSCLGKRILFVTSHLAAHQNNVAERNTQYAKICTDLFGNCYVYGDTHNLRRAHCRSWVAVAQPVSRGSSAPGALPPPPAQPPAGPAEAGKPADELCEGPPTLTEILVNRFDAVIWLGDLNYRVDGNRHSIDYAIGEEMLEVLRANDQLSRERKAGRAFSGFQEGEVAFRPTYKYDINSDNYDSSHKARIPSWTDRIQYWVKPGGPVSMNLQEYSDVAAVRVSDHRPVFAKFLVNVPAHEPPLTEVEFVSAAVCGPHGGCVIQ